MSTTATGGSTTTAILDATTGVDEGVYLAIQDNTSPTAAHSGRVFIRQVASYNSGTSTWVTQTGTPEFTVADIANGKLRYVPLANENGSNYTTFQFKVSDGTAYSASAYAVTVNVTVIGASFGAPMRS